MKFPINEALIHPGMRRLVRWLRELDLETTDSGDGITNVTAGMEDALPEPHVFCLVPPAKGMELSHMLLGACRARGLPLKQLRIEFSYSPIDEEGILALFGVCDADLPDAILP